MRRTLGRIALALIAVAAVVIAAAGVARPDGGAGRDQAAARAGSSFAGTFASAAGTLSYIGFLPSSWRPGRSMPLLVALHGCGERASRFRRLTGFDRLAQARGFIVVYPEQSQAANAFRCWNWFLPPDELRGGVEPALIAGLTEQVARRYGADRSRIDVAGFSAGGAMAAVIGADYPDLYAAIGLGSGCEYVAGVGCLYAGATDPALAGWAAFLAMGAAARPVPALVFQGDADLTVPGLNGLQLVRQWQVAADWSDDGAPEGSVPLAPSTVVQGRVPGGRAYTVSTFPDARGHELAQLWIVHGMGHAWSGGCSCEASADPLGPSESAAMVDFFMRHPMPGNGSSSAGARP